MKKSEIRRLACLCFPQQQPDCAQAESKRTHRLWAGKGSIYRVDLPNHHKPFLIKHITPSNTSGSQQSSLGDRRKAASYVVEANFYEKLASILREKHGVKVPDSYHVERGNNGEIIICMEYLQETTSEFSQQEYTKAVLAWLAAFHASHWNITTDEIDRIGLQPMGSYWYLDTRPDEHASMSSKGWIGRLKMAARAIDERLKQDRFMAVIHGDVKDANVIITRDKQQQDNQRDNPQQQLFMCDFQYCGRGPPSRDLAYFLCSIPDLHREEQYLEYYLKELQKRLPSSCQEEIPSLSELQESMDFAYCDFIRFMIGWAGHWGFNKELEDRVKRRVLDRLDGGKNLDSEEAYIEAMEREFGSF